MKNRIYIILGLLLLNSVFSFGQTSKIDIGGFVEPNYSMIKLKKQNNDEITQLFCDSFKKHSEYKFGYDFGITISYVFKGKLLFFTGVNYSNKGYKDRYNTDDFIFLEPEPELPNEVIVNRNYYYIGVPLLFG